MDSTAAANAGTAGSVTIPLRDRSTKRRQSTVVGDDDGQANRHRFQHRHRVRLADRRQHIDVRRPPSAPGIASGVSAPSQEIRGSPSSAARNAGPFPLIVARPA